MTALLYFLFLILNELDVYEYARNDTRGPVFTNEPPLRVEFANSTGTELRCDADGVPTPTITWLTNDGQLANDIPGLRHVRMDGTLVFSPFSRTEYREDVHDTAYQCSAFNSVGSILSRNVCVKGFLQQRFFPVVYDEFVARGNTAVLRCHLPTFVKDYIVVDSWIKNEGHMLNRTENKGQSYTLLRSGELLIFDVSMEDSKSGYRCQTRNVLTGEILMHPIRGNLIVTDPHTALPPRVVFHPSRIHAEEGSTAQLPCVAQGIPPVTYRWKKNMKSVHEDERIWIHQGLLNINNVNRADTGKYECFIRNSVGERSVLSILIVTAALSAHIQPSHQIVNLGNEAIFNCNVTGYPDLVIRWKKDQRPLDPSTRVRFLSDDVLRITSVRREDAGMYQCFVFNDQDSAQGTAELKIAEEETAVSEEEEIKNEWKTR